MNSLLLYRDDWLRSHGFELDPFDIDFWNAETDTKVIENFVFPKNYPDIVGELFHPKHYFIFAPSGGGKSYLRKYIKAQFDNPSSPITKDRILPIEYHVAYYEGNATTLQHIQRLIDEINDVLANHSHAKVVFTDSITPEKMLERIVNSCREIGYHGIYILVDNISSQNDPLHPDLIFQRISELIKDFKLLRIKGVVFKFFLPLSLYEIVSTRYANIIPSPPVIQWDRYDLREILHRKLESCLSRKIRTDRSVETFVELFDEPTRNSIVDEIVDFGFQAGNPRAMLLLGSYILGEHFISVNGRRNDELISQEELTTAIRKAKREILIESPGSLETSEPTHTVSHSGYDVFISHAWEDNDFSDRLASALREKGLRVWYDKSEIVVGDEIILAIENGLSTARYVILVLSPSYFKKKWTKEEYITALNLEDPNQKKLLPICHGATLEQIKKFSPVLGTRLILRSDIGMERLVSELLQITRGKDKS